MNQFIRRNNWKKKSGIGFFQQVNCIEILTSIKVCLWFFLWDGLRHELLFLTSFLITLSSLFPELNINRCSKPTKKNVNAFYYQSFFFLSFPIFDLGGGRVFKRFGIANLCIIISSFFIHYYKVEKSWNNILLVCRETVIENFVSFIEKSKMNWNILIEFTIELLIKYWFCKQFHWIIQCFNFLLLWFTNQQLFANNKPIKKV
jgi:hypothetical protein